MKKQTRTLALLGLGSALLTGVANAQPPAADQGAVSNAPAATTTTSTTTTQTSGDPMSADSSAMDDTGADSTLPQTGGEPWMLVLGGTTIAGSALLLRRRLG